MSQDNPYNPDMNDNNDSDSIDINIDKTKPIV